MKKIIYFSLSKIRAFFMRKIKPRDRYHFCFKSLKPLSSKFGFDRGTPIDRFWIESFLKDNSHDIQGNCLEITDNTYTMKYGKSNIRKSDVLDIDPNNKLATIHGDLRHLPQISDNSYDCIVLTHVLGLINDVEAAIRECNRILKPGGVLLVTSSCLSPINSGDPPNYWRFTPDGFRYLFGKNFPHSLLQIKSYGNVLTGQYFWVGMAQEELTQAEIEYNDPKYPCIVAARVIKKIEEKIPVTIGVSAYNEQANIKQLIRTILNQSQDTFILKEIIIISDGSSDNTTRQVESVNDKRIRLISSTKKLGKSVRLNQIFKLAKGKVIVLVDADVLPTSTNTISNLISPIITDKTTALTSGRFVPYKARNFIEESINSSRYAYNRAKLRFKNGDNALFCGGKLLAISSHLSKITSIPAHVTADDAYLYFSCLTHGYKFKYVPAASVLFRSPNSISDQVKQNARYLSHRKQIKDIFGDLVDKEYALPKSFLYQSLLYQFITDPLHSITIFLINFYSKRWGKATIREKQKEKRGWGTISSTKETITI